MSGRALGQLLAALVVAGGLAACQDANRPPVSTNTLADSADQVMYDVRSVITNSGVQRGELFADTAYVFDDNRRFEFRVVKVEFNKATGVKDGVMKAKRGRYDIGNGVLEGFGDVEIVTTDGRKITSPHLRYDQARNLVSSDSAFVMSEGGRVQRGVGFEADPQLNRFVCKSRCGGSAPVALPDQ